MNNNIVGAFRDISSASQAVRELMRMGYDSGDIHFKARDNDIESTLHNVVRGQDSHGSSDHRGFVEKIKDTLTGDTGSSSFGTGAYTTGGFFGSDSRFDDYLDRGDILVAVDSSGGRDSSVRGVFSQYGGVDTDASGSPGTSSSSVTGGTLGMTDTTTSTSSSQSWTDTDHDRERTMKLREEQVQINKERVLEGEVILSKEITEQRQTVNVPVTHEEVYIEHHAVPERVDTSTPIGEGGTIRVAVSEEQLHVDKTTVAREDVIAHKEVVEEIVQVPVTLSHEEARIEREGAVVVNEDGTGINTSRSSRHSQDSDSLLEKAADKVKDKFDGNSKSRR